MTRKKIIELRGEQDKVPTPDGTRYMNCHNICNSAYSVTKYETERLVHVFRKENPGYDFPVEEVNFKFDRETNEYTTLDKEGAITSNFQPGQSIYHKSNVVDLRARRNNNLEP